MTIDYLDLTDFVLIASAVTELDPATVLAIMDIGLADSALHAPAAGYGGVDFYPELVDNAAVLIVHLARNHPLPDGNKRAAWVALRLFIDLNGATWSTFPSIDEAESAVVAIASGEWDEARTADWLRRHVRTPTET